jgi:hypothetical protein
MIISWFGGLTVSGIIFPHFQLILTGTPILGPLMVNPPPMIIKVGYQAEISPKYSLEAV